MVAIYNKILWFILKPFISFLSVTVIFYTLFHNGILSNCIFSVIFLFLLSFFIILIFYQFFYEKPAFRRIGAFYINMSVFYAGEQVVIKALIQKGTSVVSSMTQGQALAGLGALAVTGVAFEAVSNQNLANASNTRIAGFEKDAAQSREDNLPNMAAYCDSLAQQKRENEEARVPGGRFTSAVYNYATSLVSPAPVPDSQDIQRLGAAEILESRREAAFIELGTKQEKLRRERERVEELHERERLERAFAARAEEWKSMDSAARFYVHYQRLQSTVAEVSDSLSQSETGNHVQQTLTTRLSRALSTIIGRVELVENPFPVPEKQTFNFDEKSSIKTSSVDSTTHEEDYIGAYYTDESQNREKRESSVLTPALPLNKEFWDALQEYHTELKDIQKEIEKDVKAPQKKD